MFPQSNFVLVLLAATTRCFSSEGMAEGNDAGRIALCFTHAHYRKVSVFSVDELSETTENDSVDAERALSLTLYNDLNTSLLD